MSSSVEDMPGNHRGQALAPVAALLVLTIMSAIAIERLYDYSFDYLRTQSELTSLRGALNTQEVLEYEAIQDKEVGPNTEQRTREARGRMLDAFDSLEERGFDEDSLARLRDSTGDYTSAVDKEFRLIEAGRVEAAEELDESRVDPISESLDGSLDALQTEYERLARRADTVADLGTAGIALLAALAGIAAFTLYGRGYRGSQEMLRRSEERFRSLVQNSSDVITLVDENGKITYQSSSIRKVLGYRPEERIGQNIYEDSPVHPEDVEKRDALVRRAVEGGRGTKTAGLVRLIGLDGSVRQVEYTVTNLLDDPSVGGVLINSRDVTDRAEAERRFSALLANTPAMVYRCLNEPGWPEVFASDYALELTGYPPEDLMVDGVVRYGDLIAQEDRERVWNETQEALEKRERYRILYDLVHRDGTYRRVEEHGQGVYDDEGKAVAIEGLVYDVTGREETRRRLAEAEELFRSVVDNSSEVISICDPDGTLRWTNGAIQRVLGWSPEEIIGRNVLDYVHPEDLPVVAERTADALARGTENGEVVRNTAQYRYRHKDGSWRWMDAHGAYMMDHPRVRGVLVNARDVTARKSYEDRLREAEARYRALIENVPAVVYVQDLSNPSRTTYISPQIADMQGYTAEEILADGGEQWTRRLHPDDRERVFAEDERTNETGEPFRMEYRQIARDGNAVWVRDEAVLVRDGDGNPMFWQGVLLDVTDRKKAEERLAEAETRYRTLVEHIPAVTYVQMPGEDGQPAPTVYTSPQVAEQTGYPPQAFTEDPTLWVKIIHPDDHDRVMEEEVRTQETGEPFRVEYRITRRDGKIAWLRDEAVLVRGDDGSPLFWQGVQIDVTDRKNAEAALRDSEERYRLVSRATNEAIWDNNLKTGTQSWGGAAEEMFGYALQEIPNDGSWWEERIHPDDRERVLSSLQAVLDTGKDAWTGEYRFVRKDGTYAAVVDRGYVMRDRENEPVRMIGSMLDISERARAEEELREAREAAEAANRAKSEFLANMSHEIRTPMNGVIGMTELLLDTPLSPEQREFVETVRLSGESLLEIINDILDFSKIEAGQMRLETTDFDLRAAVEDVMALFAGRAHDKGLEFASLVDYDVPTALRGDPGRIRQVLSNLVSNAIKFTDKGEVVLRVERLAELSDDQAERVGVRVSIRDTGIGMTPEQQRHVFESFSQADASTTRRYGGTGLGLTISKQLVELMGGEMGVESEVGVGSTFSFVLPLRRQPAGAQAAQPRTELDGLRALVVDDNATNRNILTRQLSSWGVKTESSADGRGALERLQAAAEREDFYDLAILDMQMPGMDGMELARRITADPTLPQTRLILLTSVGQRGDGEEARETGIRAYLTKPVRQLDLHDALATVMGDILEDSPEETRLVTRHSLREGRAVDRARVLLAEDNPVNQKVAVKMLENLGYRVDVARNGREAVEAIFGAGQGPPYAAVLMDVQMPNMDGYEATAEIRRREGGPGLRTPIIAMTANAMVGDQEKALSAGMDDYLAKPVKVEKLGEVLRRWVGEPAPEPSPVTDEGVFDEEATLDQEVLATLRGLGEPKLLSELAAMFVRDASERLAVLERAVDNGDAQTVEGAAHDLKGSAGNIGASRMARICADLQNLGARDDLSRAAGLIEELEKELGRVKPALEKETGSKI